MLKGLGQMGDMAKMMKAAQEMQGKMAQMQEDLATMTVVGESGAGLVKATGTAKGELTGLDIDPSIFNGDDKEVVEDLILAAIKDAQQKAQDKSQEEMAKLTEGLGLPPGMNLPFQEWWGHTPYAESTVRDDNDIDALISMMARLPGLGPRSARRAALHMIRKRGLLLGPLADLMTRVARDARECLNCGNIGTQDICEICQDNQRNTGILCVVEDVSDLWAMERAGVFKGRYHVLGGTLSALDQVGPEELRIPKLQNRVDSEEVTEVILALNATIDGQTTAHYIADQLEGRVTLTSLAQGVPIGGELDYLDEGTITAALNARKAL